MSDASSARAGAFFLLPSGQVQDESARPALGVVAGDQRRARLIVADPKNIVRVEFSALEDCRRAVFLCLAGIDERKRARLAGVITASLREAGLLGGSVEQHYSAAQVAALCGGRSSAWAGRHARAGDFGPVICDGGDWLIPASGVNDYLARYVVGVATPGKKDGAESVSGSEKENANAPGMNGSAGGLAAGRAGVRSGGRRSQVIDGQIAGVDVVAGDAACLELEARIRREAGGGMPETGRLK